MRNMSDSKDLWQDVKSLVRSQENDDACLIFDDTIVSKPYTDKNELFAGIGITAKIAMKKRRQYIDGILSHTVFHSIRSLAYSCIL